jgi:hypothetical protein
MIRLDPSTKSETSWTCLQVPSRALGIRFYISQKAIIYIIHSSRNPSLKITKASEDLGGWNIWIHEELQFDQLSLIHVRTIYLVHLLHHGNKKDGREGRFSVHGA